MNILSDAEFHAESNDAIYEGYHRANDGGFPGSTGLLKGYPLVFPGTIRLLHCAGSLVGCTGCRISG